MIQPLLATASRYFLEVARIGSVTEAAKQLHVAASAISRQIAKLEDSLDCALFERQARGMVLSEAGERLAAYLRNVSFESERVLEEVRGLGAQGASRVEVACTDGFSVGFMPQVMSAFRQAHPHASLHLRVGSPDDVSRWLLRGEVNLGVKFSVAPEKGLAVQHSQRAPIVAIMSPAHPLAGSSRLTVADIVRYPLALPEASATVRQVLDLVCSVQGLHYQAPFTGPYSTILALIGQAPLLSLSARLSAAHSLQQGSLSAVAVDDAQFASRAVQVLSLQGHTLSAMVSAFKEAIVEAIRQTLAEEPIGERAARRQPA